MAENDEKTEVSRIEHLEWCKDRALKYLETGDVQNAIASMLSDLGKHKQTEGVGKAMGPMGLMAVMNRDPTEARRFIEGFN